MKKWKLLLIPALLITTVILQILARFVPGFGEWYAASVYLLLVNIFSRLYSLLPFSLSEAGLYLLIILFFAGGIIGAITGGKAYIKKWLYKIALTVSLLLFTYTLGCGINYYRTPFSEKENYQIESSSVDDLADLCSLLTTELKLAAAEITLNEDGTMSLDLHQAKYQAREAMSRLGQEYPALKGYYPLPKYLINSQLLSIQKVMRIYSPFTIEANVNKDMPVFNIPVTLCHELSHLRGFMREDEANFIAYLACIASDQPEFRYSGLLLAYTYSMSALARTGEMELYFQIWGELPETAKIDLYQDRQFWESYDSKVAEAANQMNDAYLKANSQEDGVKSYGRMVDLLLAHYK